MRFRSILLVALLLISHSFADTALQSEMLRSLFRLPTAEWSAHLGAHQDLLDDTFFENVGKRVAWALANEHLDDACRFAMVGDYAASASGRSSRYRLELIGTLEDSGWALAADQLRSSWPELSRDADRPEYRFAPSRDDLEKVSTDLLQVEMLAGLFQLGKGEWPSYLRNNVSLLTPQFLDAVEEEIRRALNFAEWAKAIDLALLADLGALANGRVAQSQMNVLETL